MSKERELLVRIYRFLKSNVENDFGLGSDIRELLTHPEPEQQLKEIEVALAEPEQDPRDFNFYAHMFESGFMRAGREASASFIKEANKRESKETADKLQDLATYGVSFSKGGKRIDPRDVYISTGPEQEPVGYLYKQMECTGEWATIFKVDKPYITWHDIKDIVPVYTSPQKREPLGLEIMDVCGTEDYREGFKDGALYAEKCHGIGVGNV